MKNNNHQKMLQSIDKIDKKASGLRVRKDKMDKKASGLKVRKDKIDS